MSENTATPATMPTLPPSAHPRLAALHAHFSNLLHKAQDVAHAVVAGFEAAAQFVEKEAPVVEAAAVAVASAVPVVGPIAAVVGKVAGEAAAVASRLAGCSCTCEAAHGPNGCTGPGCSCPAAPAASAAQALE